MLEFKTITIEDKDLFSKYLNINRYPNSEYNFTTIYAWRRAYRFKYAVVNDCLCVSGVYDGGNELCFFPLGEEKDVIEAISQLKDDFKARGKAFGFVSLSEGMLEMLKRNGLADDFSIKYERDYCDYVYKRETIVNLKGKKLHGKRNHFNYFIQNYNYEFSDITDDAACEEKLRQLINDRSADPEQELVATISVLKNRDELGLIGKCLLVDGKIAGIILGENHHGVALIQIAKSDTEYRGAAVALFQLFLQDYFTDAEYTNFMEDIGLEGLRKAKMSYAPEFFVDKYSAKPY